MSAALEIIRVHVNGQDAPMVVMSRELVSIPIERTVDKKTLYEDTGYVAVHVRPATAEEVQAWKSQR